TALASMLALALVGGLVVSTTQWRRATENAHAASANAARANAIAWAQRRDAVWRAFDEGRGFDALPLLVENLREQEAAGQLAESALDRRRLGTLLASSPVLIDAMRVLPTLDRPMHGGTSLVSMTPDGATVLVGTMPGGAAAVDVASGALRWHRELGILRNHSIAPIVSPDGLEFSIGICRVVHPSGACGIRLDIATGAERPVAPGFVDPAAARYSPDGRHAVVFSADGARQAWRTDPWRAVSPLQPADDRYLVLVASDGSAIYRTAAGATLLSDGIGLRDRMALVSDLPAFGAWAYAADRSGRRVAMPWVDDQLATIDIGTLELRQRPDPCSSQISAIEFSSDDAWLGVGCLDGFVHVLDAATLEDLVDPIPSGSQQVHRVATHAQSRRVLVTASGEIQLWRLATRPGPAALATRESPSLAVAGGTATQGLAYDPRRGLLAAGSNNGWIKFWRLRPSPRVPGAAPPIASQATGFDGRHVVLVDGASAWVHDVAARRAVSPRFEHPQPVAQSLLASGGATLVVASGRETHAWDWRGGQARLPPTAWPATPAWVEVDRRGGRLLVGWLQTRRQVPEVALAVQDLADGRVLATTVLTSGVVDLRIDGDDHVLVRRHRAIEVLRLHDLSTLHAPRTWPLADGSPSVLTDARLDGDALWATTNVVGVSHATTRVGEPLSLPQLLRWQPGQDGIQVGDVTGMYGRIALDGNGGMAFAAALPNDMRRHVLRTADGTLVWMAVPGAGFQHLALAYSADGTLLARGLEDGAIVTDAASGTPLSPPLRVALDPGDLVTQLAFAPDNGSLLARTEQGRWLHWPIATDARPLAEVARHAALLPPPLMPLYFEQHPEPDAATRRALRAMDPGVAPNPDRGPDAIVRVAATDSDAPNWRFIDLSPWRTPSADASDGQRAGLLPASVPRGLQRLDGVDFAIGDAVQLGQPLALPDVPAASTLGRPEQVPLPPGTTRLHLLLGDFRARNHVGPVATVVLHFRDGGSARQILDFPRPETRRLSYAEILGQVDAAAAAGANLAWVARSVDSAMILAPVVPLYHLAIDNPEPDRAVNGFSLLPGSHPVLVAATVDAPGRPDDSGAAAVPSQD
ncbi:MAG: hypothetical protein KAX84_17770, partial [Burkholderiales bacterium]|nr:hypothetical protein [Burkholderiales bacterium]